MWYIDNEFKRYGGLKNMTLKDFCFSFLSIACKPKSKEWNMRVIENKTSEVLTNGCSMGDYHYAPIGTGDREVVAWSIQYNTILVIVE